MEIYCVAMIFLSHVYALNGPHRLRRCSVLNKHSCPAGCHWAISRMSNGEWRSTHDWEHVKYGAAFLPQIYLLLYLIRFYSYLYFTWVFLWWLFTLTPYFWKRISVLSSSCQNRLITFFNPKKKRRRDVEKKSPSNPK